MLALRKAFAGLLLALTLPVSLVTAWHYGILSTYLNQNFYHSSFFEEKVYPAIIEQGTKQIIGKIDELGQYVSQQDIKEQLILLLPADGVQNLIDDLFEQLGQRPLPKVITISFKELKKNIPQVIGNVLKMVEGKIGSPFPQAAMAQEFQAEVDRMMPDELKIPTQQIMENIPNKQQAIIQLIMDERGLQVFRWGLWILWGGLLALMGLLIFSRTALRWWGITLTLDALSILAISQILKEGLAQAIQETEWVQGITLLQPIFKSISLLGFSVLALGIAFILSQYWLKPHHPHHAPRRT